MRTRILIVTAMACLGSLTGFPNPVLHLPWMVLLLPMALMLAGQGSKTFKQAFIHGFVAGSAAAAAALYWLVIPVSRHGGIPLPLALPCPVLTGCYLGCFWGLMSMGCRWAWRALPVFLFPLAAGILWYGAEFGQSTVLGGFPWLTLPSALAFTPWAVQGAAIVGGMGLSALLAAGAGLLLCSTKQPLLLVPATVLGGVLFWGGQILLDTAPKARQSFSVALIQGNIDQDQKWDEAYQNATVDKYLALTNQALEHAPDLVVWPETAMPFYLQDLTDHTVRIRQYVHENTICLVTGAPGYTFTALAPPEYEIFNRLICISPDSGPLQSYDKEHLVPFGEYVPLGRYLPFVSKLTHGSLDFSSGPPMADPLVCGPIRLGPLICYEAIFPYLAMDRVRSGANVLLNISNDAWFGRSSAPLQHLALAALRAVENGRFMIRGTNTGISAVIDNTGRILRKTSSFQDAILAWPQVGLLEKNTIYTGIARYIPWTAAAAALLLALSSVFRARKRG